MWADIATDGTVVVGFRFPGYSEVELVLDKELGELRKLLGLQFMLISNVEINRGSRHLLKTRQLMKAIIKF